MRSSVSVFVTFFFLCSIVCSNVIPVTSGTSSHIASFLKKPASTTKSGAQLLEKVESESDVKPHLNFLFIYQVGEILRFDMTGPLHICFYHAFRFRGNISGIPLYLIKRSILI